MSKCTLFFLSADGCLALPVINDGSLSSSHVNVQHEIKLVLLVEQLGSMYYLIIKCICVFVRSLIVEAGFISIVDVIGLIFFKEWLQDELFPLSKVGTVKGFTCQFPGSKVMSFTKSGEESIAT